MRFAVVRRFGLGFLVPLIVLGVGTAAFLWNPLPLEIVRNAVFDQFQRWQPRAYEDVGVRIVDIDEESLQRLGQWPWPRTLVADLVTRLQDAGAAVIAFDVMFAEGDRSSPAAMREVWQASPALRAELDDLPDHDEVFGDALARGRVVLGFSFAEPGARAGSPEIKARYVVAGEVPRVHAFSGAVPPLEMLGKAAAGSGAIAFVPDSDGVVRRVPMVFRLNGSLVPSLAAETLRIAAEERNFTIRTNGDGGDVSELRVGAFAVPTTPAGEAWIHYSEPHADRYIPAWKVLGGAPEAGRLAGQTVLIGASAPGLMDLRFGPLNGLMPGVEAHAQMLEQVFAGESLSRPSWATAIEMLVILCGGVLVGAIALGASAMLSLGAFVFVLGALWAGAWQSFAAAGVLLDAANPTLVLVAVFVSASIVRHRSSERRQRWVREAFSRYVSPNLVNHLIAHPDALELGGRRQECSFVFTDLAGFTTLLERMDPGEAVALLNDYLDGLIAIAFSHHGTLDRIVGDAVAIMFSAPVIQADHRHRAMSCAMAMHRFASTYAAELNASGVAFGRTRLGIHTGEVIVGNFGGKTIFDYRALGDPVNTAARLEGLNKHVGTLLCVSGETLSGCAAWPARAVGRVILKGKTAPLAVFEPLDPEADGPDQAYDEAMTALRAGSPEALGMFEQLAAVRPQDALVTFHLARLRSGGAGDLLVMTEK